MIYAVGLIAAMVLITILRLLANAARQVTSMEHWWGSGYDD